MKFVRPKKGDRCVRSDGRRYQVRGIVDGIVVARYWGEGARGMMHHYEVIHMIGFENGFFRVVGRRKKSP